MSAAVRPQKWCNGLSVGKNNKKISRIYTYCCIVGGGGPANLEFIIIIIIASY